MQLSERIGSSESVATVLLAAGNACYFGAYAARAPARPRRIAARALVLANVALASEALLYVALLPDTASAREGLAALLVRTLALLAVASISALVLRQRAARRGRGRT